MGLLQSIRDGKFCIVAEFTPHSASEVKHIADIAKGLIELNKKYAPEGIVFAGVSLTQNPGGNLSYDHQASLAILRECGFPQELEVVPHITGKDMNVDAIRTLLISLSERGIQTILALTGDAPLSAKGVFEVDSLGLLQLVKRINVERLHKCRNADEFASLPVLTAGAAVSPFKYTEGAMAMQLIKASKKIREGAAFLTCQSGWDADRSGQLAKQLAPEGAPLIGNALVVNEVAAKFMQQLPGCVITDAFLGRLRSETTEDNLVRAGQQLAMFRALGYKGVDLGKPGEFESAAQIEKVVDTALAVKDWREFKDNIHFPAPESRSPRVKKSAAMSWAFHNATFDEKGALHGVAKATLAPFNNSAEKEGALYKLFRAVEGFGKELLYECAHCGDCYLPENQFVCTMGSCEKGLPNPPCGDADPRGYCGKNKDRICVGERIYRRMLHYNALEEFKKMTMPPRKADLQDSASVLNYFFGRDHASKPNPLKGSGLIQIAELLHASIPFPGAALKYLRDAGPEGFEKPNRGLDAVEDLIRSQAEQGADYIDINIDALRPPNAPDMMRRLVRLVHRLSGGVPPCIDSSDVNVLVAGLEEWFSLGAGLRPPLLNSIPFVDMEKMAPVYALRGKQRFSAINLLVGPEGPLKSSDEMVNAAKKMFTRATEAGFRAEEILFDCVTLGIATDSCIDATGTPKPSHTHNSFNAIRRIRQDPEMKGVHAVLGVSNWVYGATKRRIGHIRAFIAVAQEYGLDGAIVDVEKGFGITPAAPELVDFVKMFVALDGAEDSMMDYSAKMQEARQMKWI